MNDEVVLFKNDNLKDPQQLMSRDEMVKHMRHARRRFAGEGSSSSTSALAAGDARDPRGKRAKFHHHFE